MMRLVRKKYLHTGLYWLVLAAVVLAPVLPPRQLAGVMAALSSCSASVTPQIVEANKVVNLVFTVTNTDNNDIRYVRITSPSAHFSINGGSSSGWSRTFSASQITFTNGVIASGSPHQFTVRVQTGPSEVPAAAWDVRASDAANGSALLKCSGNTNVAISTDEVPPVISNVSVSGITQAKATVTWNTDKPATSVLQYGTTPSYGSEKSDNTFKTSHSIDIENLASDTQYHFKVRSVDSVGNASESGGHTFTTLAVGGIEEPKISNISVQSSSSSEVTITWTTNRPMTSRVLYGPTSSYGLSSVNNTMKTFHSVTLTQLASATTYHYRLEGTDSAGAQAQTGNNTFTTSGDASPFIPGDTGEEASFEPSVRAPFRPGRGSPSSSGFTPPVPGSAERGEHELDISLVTDFSVVYDRPPEIEGIVANLRGRQVQVLEYSTDNGHTWVAIEDMEYDRSDIHFRFLPQGLGDGTHLVVVRAEASDELQSTSPVYSLVIDRLPPMVGMSIYTHGSQLLQPDSRGVISTISGLNKRIIVAVSGGVTKVEATASLQSDLDGTQVFSLARNAETGLWSGTVSFDKAGVYAVLVSASDGVDKKSERQLYPIVVLPAGRVIHGQESVPDAEVTVFAWEPIRQQFIEWDGSTFYQENPQQPDSGGSYRFLLPAGSYYIQVSAPGFRTLRSQLFELEDTQPIYADIPLEKRRFFLFWPKRADLEFADGSTGVAGEVLLGVAEGDAFPVAEMQRWSDFSHPSRFMGRPAIVSFVASWLPQAGAQISILHDIAETRNVQTAVVMVQESVAATRSFQHRGGYRLPFFADPYGEFAELMHIHTVPTHVFLDEHGRITDVAVGVLSREELLERI